VAVRARNLTFSARLQRIMDAATKRGLLCISQTKVRTPYSGKVTAINPKCPTDYKKKKSVGSKSAIENFHQGPFSHKPRPGCAYNSGMVVLERDLLLTLNHRVVGSIPTQPTFLVNYYSVKVRFKIQGKISKWR